MPLNKMPTIPHAPCTGNASNGSSILKCNNNLDAHTYVIPDVTPIKSDHHSFAASQLPVIPTNPDSRPFDNDDTFSTFSNYMIKNYTVRLPADPESVVFIHTFEINRLS